MGKRNKKPANQSEIYISGMHCSACELLIEKKLMKKEHVASVTISRKDAKARVTFDNQSYLNIEQLNEEFKDLGYQFSHSPIEKPKNKLWHKDANGKKTINQEKLKQLIVSFAIALIFLISFYFIEKLQLGSFISVDINSALPAFFLLGLVAGVSSCAALIGGLLLSLVKRWHEDYIDTEDHKKRKTPHVLFHAGRLAGFFILGGILGLIGDQISLNNTTVYATLVLIISILMIILALQMLDISWAQKISLRLPKSMSRLATKEGKKGKYAPFMTGALTFFLPCGFTLIAQGVALTTGSFLQGGLIMLVFALGTLPLLLGISATGLRFTKKPHLTARFSKIAGIIVLFFALYNINGQLNVLGYASLSDIVNTKHSLGFSEIYGPMSVDPALLAGEEQLLKFVAQDFSYIPVGPITLQAGIPTKMVVEDRGILGCGAFIAARGLFNGYVPLKLGENVIDLGIPKPGTYKVTCSMGMVPPVTVTFN